MQISSDDFLMDFQETEKMAWHDFDILYYLHNSRNAVFQSRVLGTIGSTLRRNRSSN